MEQYCYKRRHGGFALLYTLTKMSPTKWGAEINKYTCPITPSPFYPFLTYTLSWTETRRDWRGGTTATPNFQQYTTDTVQRHLLYTISKQQRGRSVQLVQVKSKNSPHPKGCNAPSRRQHQCSKQGVPG